MTQARRKLSPTRGSAKDKDIKAVFTPTVFEGLADDLAKGRIPLKRVTVSDDIVTGLRAVIRNTGLISYHVTYDVDGSRPYLKIGDHPQMKLEEARNLARTVQSLAEKGIDVQAGLHERLIKQLKEQGAKWRP